MKLSLFQMDAALGGMARTAAIEAAVTDAARAGSSLVLLPELAVGGYGAGAAIAETALPLEALAASFLQAAAERSGLAIVAGMALRNGGHCLNSAVLFRPGLAPVAYHKRRLYGDYEKALFTPGAAASPIVEWAGLKLGLLVCFDVEFPELVRELALAGAELILVPTALPRSEGASFIARSLVPTRAFENHVFLAYANHCGADAMFAYQGLSSIMAPDGTVLACADEQPAHLTAELDPGAYDESRRQNPYLDIVRAVDGVTSR